jgi:predicted amidohydrolase
MQERDHWPGSDSMRSKVKDNLNNALNMVEKAADQGANIVCLPEAFSSKFFAQYESEEHLEGDVLQEIPGRIGYQITLENG